ncbi:MAG: hypothetical protein ACO1OB_12505, partial [Archangium sp.]
MTFVFVAVVMSVAVDVSVEAGAPCVARPSLESALTTRGLHLGKGGLDVRVSGSPSQLVLTASRGAQKFDRTVPVERGDCDAVTRVVVALIQSWATAPRAEAARADGGVALARVRVSSDGGASPADVTGSATRASVLGDAGTPAAGGGATTRVSASIDGGGSS